MIDAGLGQARVLGRGPGQAEIEDLDAAARRLQPDVGRLDVAVNQAALVGRRQTFGDLPADAQRLGQGQRPFAAQPRLQRLAQQQPHDEVGDAAILADLIDGDDVVVLDGGGSSGLAEKALAVGGPGGDARQHGLDRHGAQQDGVVALKHHAHAAGAEDF